MTGGLETPIAASSLLMTMLALVYAAWSGAIRKAIDIPLSVQAEERKSDKRALMPTFFFQAIPLALATVAATVIFLPRACEIWAKVGPPYDLSRIDDVGGAFVLTHLLIAGIAVGSAIDMARLAYRLCSK